MSLVVYKIYNIVCMLLLLLSLYLLSHMLFNLYLFEIYIIWITHVFYDKKIIELNWGVIMAVVFHERLSLTVWACFKFKFLISLNYWGGGWVPNSRAPTKILKDFKVICNMSYVWCTIYTFSHYLSSLLVLLFKYPTTHL